MHFLARIGISRFVAFIDFSGFSGFEIQTIFFQTVPKWKFMVIANKFSGLI